VNQTTMPVFKNRSTFYTVIFCQDCMIKLTRTKVHGISTDNVK
jgi:hypothetical protein